VDKDELEKGILIRLMSEDQLVYMHQYEEALKTMTVKFREQYVIFNYSSLGTISKGKARIKVFLSRTIATRKGKNLKVYIGRVWWMNSLKKMLFYKNN
jgi:hypothetical protein